LNAEQGSVIWNTKPCFLLGSPAFGVKVSNALYIETLACISVKGRITDAVLLEVIICVE
jgi:hypothetical protein